jgi:hypothetical protein
MNARREAGMNWRWVAGWTTAPHDSSATVDVTATRGRWAAAAAASSSRCHGLGAPTLPASHGRERTHWIKVHQDSLRR